MLSVNSDERSAQIAELLKLPLYRRLMVAGFLLVFTQWSSIFLGAYSLARAGASGFTVEAVTAVYYIPIVLFGPLLGKVSDRIDRRTVGITTCVTIGIGLVPVSAFMDGSDPTISLVLAFLFIAGFGTLSNVVFRSGIIADLVGPHRVSDAMIVDSIPRSVGLMSGPLIMGSAIGVVGYHGALSVVIACYLAAAVIFVSVGQRAGSRAAPASGLSDAPTLVEQARPVAGHPQQGLSFLKSRRTLRSVLLIIILMNVCYFANLPLIPLIGLNFTESSTLIGLLQAATGIGAIAGVLACIWIRAANPGRRLPIGRLYYAGSLTAIFFLLAVTAGFGYVVAFGFLVACGVGQSCFSMFQTTLVIQSAEPRFMGVALGWMGRCIGTTPAGAVLAGFFVSVLGLNGGLAVLIGAATLIFVVWFFRPPIPLDGMKA